MGQPPAAAPASDRQERQRGSARRGCLPAFHWGTLQRLKSPCRHFCHAARTHEQEHDKLLLRPLFLVVAVL
jgi:hypothetical protein